MKFQLVLQFQTAGDLNDLNHLIGFEDTLSLIVGSTANVDGHDLGSGEVNIFMLTDDPVATFKLVQEIDSSKQLHGKIKAAYRPVDRDDYVILWPPGLKHFKVA